MDGRAVGLGLLRSNGGKPERFIGMHLAPREPSHDIGDSDPAPTSTYVTRELGRRSFGFLFVRATCGSGTLLPAIKREFKVICVANDGFDIEAAKGAVATGAADAVEFGRL